MPKRKDGTYTGNPRLIIRLEQPILTRLVKAAGVKQVTPNALASKVIRDWVEFNISTRRAK